MKRALVLLALLAIAAPAGAADGLGLNVHQSSGVGLDATKGCSLGWVRIDANWLDAEKSQGQFDFTVFDAVVNGAQARGLSVLAVLGYTPAWASTGDALGDGPNNDVPQAGTYAAYVTAAVNHLKDRVTYFELWNEPDLQQFWEGTATDYVNDVLVPGADALHAACPACKVVAPALATVGTGYATFLDTVLAAGKDKIDVVSGHDYAKFPQDTLGAGATSDSFYNKLDSHRIVKIGSTVVYEGPLSFKEVMDAHGATQPFWITETGIEAALGDSTAEDAQTLYYRRVLESMLSRSWWTNTIFYEAFDEPPAPYHFGVSVDDPDAGLGYDEKPVMAFLRKAAQNQPLFGGTGTDCTDGLDNDGDGLIDSADPDCATGNDEGAPPVDAGADAADAGSGDDAGDAEGSPGGGCSCDATGGGPSGLAVLGLAVALAIARRRGGR
jgi:MYXO-CTERM domain-containing protein